MAIRSSFTHWTLSALDFDPKINSWVHHFCQTFGKLVIVSIFDLMNFFMANWLTNVKLSNSVVHKGFQINYSQHCIPSGLNIIITVGKEWIILSSHDTHHYMMWFLCWGWFPG